MDIVCIISVHCNDYSLYRYSPWDVQLYSTNIMDKLVLKLADSPLNWFPMYIFVEYNFTTS